jgi:peptidoglycan/LPS O-acetylase OafA/YrhL
MKNAPMKHDKKIHSIQALRGFAAVAVMLFHFSGGYLSEGHWFREISNYGTYGVHAFFIISGFILPYSLYHGNYKLKSYGTFIIKRLLRLEPTYLLSIVTLLGLAFLSYSLSPYSSQKSFSINGLNLLYHIGYLVPFIEGANWLNPVFWTLAIEFQFYLLLGLIFPIMNLNSIGYKLLPIGFFMGMSFLIPSDDFLFHYAWLFGIGMLLFYWRSHSIPPPIIYIGLVILLIYAAFFQSVPEIAVALISIYIIQFTNINSWFTNLLGDASYPLYLFHNVIGASVILHFAQHFVKGDAINLLLIFISSAICIFGSWLLYRYFEKPFIRWSKKMKY